MKQPAARGHAPLSSIQWLARASKSRIAQNAAALYGVQIMRKLLPLVLIPYLARKLGPAGWGTVAFMLSLAECVVVCIEFGFNLSATREIARARDSRDDRRRIMAGVLGAQIMLATGIVVAAALISQWIPLLRESPRLVASGLFYAVLQGFAPIWFFQGLEKMRLISVLEISGRMCGLGLVLLWVRSPEDAWLALLLQAAGPLFITTIGWSVVLRTHGFLMPSWHGSRVALKTGWPLFVYRSAESLYGVGNAFLLGLFVSPTAVGYFASAEKISKAAFGLLNPIRESLYPRLSSLIHQSREDAARLARIGAAATVGGGILLGAATFLMAPLMIRLVMGPGFEPAVHVLRIFSLLPVLLSVTHSVGLQWLLPLGRDAEVNRILLAAGALNVLTAVLVTPQFGQVGMAWVVVGAEAFVTIFVVRAVIRTGSPFAPAASNAVPAN